MKVFLVKYNIFPKAGSGVVHGVYATKKAALAECEKLVVEINEKWNLNLKRWTKAHNWVTADGEWVRYEKWKVRK